MRAIIKGQEPYSLNLHRQDEINQEIQAGRPALLTKSSYSNYKERNFARQLLCNEQFYLCAYCMKNIDVSIQTKIEHWLAQNQHVQNSLDWNNLLGVCSGRTDGDDAAPFHCDTSRGRLPTARQHLTMLHPADSTKLQNINYLNFLMDGTIISCDPDPDKKKETTHEINNILCLNHKGLKKNRAEVFAQIQNQIQQLRIKCSLPSEVDYYKIVRQIWSTPREGKLGEYCGVAIWWLDQEIQRRS